MSINSFLIMKNQILNLGKTLNKAQQIQINGGRKMCDTNKDRVCEDYGDHCAELYCAFGPFQIKNIKMKKSILNLGKTLNKAQQIQINGGRKMCDTNKDRICEEIGNHCAEAYCTLGPNPF